MYPDLGSTPFRIHSVFKNFHAGEREKNLRIPMPNSPGTCGWAHSSVRYDPEKIFVKEVSFYF